MEFDMDKYANIARIKFAELMGKEWIMNHIEDLFTQYGKREDYVEVHICLVSEMPSEEEIVANNGYPKEIGAKFKVNIQNETCELVYNHFK